MTDQKDKALSRIKNARGRDILTFVGFLLLSTFFWLLLSLNYDVQRNYKIKIKHIDLPDGIKLIRDESEAVDVNVRGKGYSLLVYEYLHRPQLTLKASDYIINSDSTELLVDKRTLNDIINAKFGDEVTVRSIHPESMNIAVVKTDMPQAQDE